MRWQPGWHTLCRMLGDLSKSRRRLAKRTQPRQNPHDRTPAVSSSAAEWIGALSATELLERISRARLQQDGLDAELALLIDHAVSLRIGWPEIAAKLGVTRQAARQQYQRRHRDGPGPQDRVV